MWTSTRIKHEVLKNAYLDLVLSTMWTSTRIKHVVLRNAYLNLVLVSTWSLTIVSMIYSCWSTWTCTPQSWWQSPLDVILHELYEIFLLTQAHGSIPNPHIGLSQRPWVSAQTRSGQCLPYHGITWSLSVHLVRFVCWSSWFTLWLRYWSTLCLYDHSLDNTLNTILVII